MKAAVCRPEAVSASGITTPMSRAARCLMRRVLTKESWFLCRRLRCQITKPHTHYSLAASEQLPRLPGVQYDIQMPSEIIGREVQQLERLRLFLTFDSVLLEQV